jgi:hypothetical protein
LGFKYKRQILSKMMIVFLIFSFATIGFSTHANAARIIPSGKVSIIQNGKIIGEFSKEIPLPEGSHLLCEAKCTVIMDDLHVVVEPDTLFSVKPKPAGNELAVERGTAYFSVRETSRPLEFKSPAGNASMREVSVSGSELQGYVRATTTKTEIGVIDGGSMTVMTSSGEKAITPGKQVTIALIAEQTPGSAAGAGGGSLTTTDIALGAAGVGVYAAAAYGLTAISWSDGGSGSDGSPSSP